MQRYTDIMTTTRDEKRFEPLCVGARDLRSAWRDVSDTLRRDLSARASFLVDPEGFFRQHGYQLCPDARDALMKALP